MKASELIAKLQAYVNAHGDHRVTIGTAEWDVEPIAVVRIVNEDHSEVIAFIATDASEPPE